MDVPVAVLECEGVEVGLAVARSLLPAIIHERTEAAKERKGCPSDAPPSRGACAIEMPMWLPRIGVDMMFPKSSNSPIANLE